MSPLFIGATIVAILAPIYVVLLFGARRSTTAEPELRRQQHDTVILRKLEDDTVFDEAIVSAWFDQYPTQRQWRAPAFRLICEVSDTPIYHHLAMTRGWPA